MSRRPLSKTSLEEKIAELQRDLPANDRLAAIARTQNAYAWATQDPRVAFALLSAGSEIDSISPLVKLVVGVAILPADGRAITEACVTLRDVLFSIQENGMGLIGDTLLGEMDAILTELYPYAKLYSKHRSLGQLAGRPKIVALEQVQGWKNRIDRLIRDIAPALRGPEFAQADAEDSTRTRRIPEIPVDWNVPVDATLFGRDVDIADTIDLLTKRSIADCPWDKSPTAHVALFGPAGIGKTSLAVRVAHESHDVGRPIFIRCENLDTLADFQAELLKIKPLPGLQRGENLEQALREELEREPLLLILDNLLASTDPTTHATYLEYIDSLTGIHSLTILITTRNPVFIGRNTPRTIHQVQLQPLTSDASEQLFRSTYAGIDEYKTYDHDHAEVTELLRAVGGLPLAVVGAATEARDAQSLRLVTSIWTAGPGLARREATEVPAPVEGSSRPQFQFEIPNEFEVPVGGTLFGRDTDTQLVHERLTKQNARFDPFDLSVTAHVVLVGPAGIGKTALSIRVATESEVADLGPPVFVRCEDLHTLTAFQSVLLKLRANPILQPWEDLEQAVLEELERKRLFLILDNLLDTYDPTSHATYLDFIDTLTSIDKLTLLITSRNRVFGGRNTPRTIHAVELRRLPLDAAGDLFRHEYTRLQRDRPVGEGEIPKVVGLLREGLPRAIVRAAALARESASQGATGTGVQVEGSSTGQSFSDPSIFTPETIIFLRLLAELPCPVLHRRDICSTAISIAIDSIRSTSAGQLEGPPSARSISILSQVRADVKWFQPHLDVNSEIVLALAINYFESVAGTLERETGTELDNGNVFPLIQLTEGVRGPQLEQARLEALLACTWRQEEARDYLKRLIDAAVQAEKHRLYHLAAEIRGSLADVLYAAGELQQADDCCREATQFFQTNHSFEDVAVSHARHLEILLAQVDQFPGI